MGKESTPIALLVVPAASAHPRYLLIAWLERRNRRQVVIVAAGVAMFLAWRSLGALAAIVLDRWWLQSVTDAPLWPTVVSAKVELTVTAVAVTGLLLGGSLALVHRRGRVSDHDVGGLVRRYRQRMGPAHRWALVGAVAVLTWRIGAAASTHWQEWLLFLHGGSVGRDVPELGGDLGDYLFRLPFLAVVSVWLRQLLIVALALTLFASWVAGELRWPWSRAGRRRTRPAALAHLGVLVALLAAAQALDDVFVRRPALAVNTSGSFVGPGYSELYVVVQATWVAALAAIVCGFVLVLAGRSRRWRLALGVVTMTISVHVAGFVAVPGLVDHFLVAPAEAAHQLPYYEHNLAGTREAFLLDSVVETERLLDDGIDAVDPTSAEAVARAPIWDVTQLAPALQVLQGRAATRITDLDLDRYQIEDELRPVMVGGTVSEPQRPA